MPASRNQRSLSLCNRVARRDAMKVGVMGATGLTLPSLLRARSAARERGQSTRDTSIVWLWMQGGAPHIETFDPKMDAPSNYRSMIGAVDTRLPGVQFGGLYPGLANMADQMAIVRSFQHTNPDHLGASHYVLTAADAPFGVTQQTKPSFGSIAAKMRGVSHPTSGIPTYIRINTTISFDFDQPLWLGAGCTPFDASGPARTNMALTVSPRRVRGRAHLLNGLDRLRREVDQTGVMHGMDSFEQQAFELILGHSTEAFDLSREDPRVREKYGPGFGEQMLMARRLCEAGAGFVSLNYCYAPTPSESPYAWDMHLGPGQPNAGPMLGQLEAICPTMDHVLTTFLQDVAQRGLSEKILLIITGDFGRTPKINQYGGRDHWPDLSTLALAGGGLRMGQVVGTSSSKAEFPTSSPIEPKDLMATIFHVLGIDLKLQFPDYAGRPQYLLPEGAEPIRELI